MLREDLLMNAPNGGCCSAPENPLKAHNYTKKNQSRRALGYPDPREAPKSRSLNGGSYNVPGPKLGDLLSRFFRGSGSP